MVLVLVGATVGIGLGFEEDADLFLQGQTQILHVDPREKAVSAVRQLTLSPRRSRNHFHSTLHSISLIDRVSTLRC